MNRMPYHSKLFWIFLVFILTTSSQAEILSGRVYEGEYLTEPPTAKGLADVSVKLYASYSSDVLGDEVSSYTTGSDGWYGLETEQNYEFFTIVCEGKSGYTFEGSSSVDGSTSGEQIEYVVPLAGKTLTGNKFWYTSETPPPANNPPVAKDDSATTSQDTAVDIDVLYNDNDPDGDPLHINSATDPPHGTTVNHGGNLTYTPDPGFTGTDTFDYIAGDGNGGTDTATVTVTVEQGGEPPAGTGTLDGYKRDADTGEGLENWRIFIDLNGNGEWEDGEPYDMTDSNGYYRISEVEPGTYRVCEQMQEGWEPGGGSSACVEGITIIEDTITTQDFHNRRTEGPEPGTGTIRGMKFNDLNSNGQRDADEPGLSDWEITLTDNDGNVLAFTTTDQNGEYQFFNLEPGTYGVSEDDKEDWFQTFPAEKHYSGVRLSQGEVLMDMDFGNHWTGTEPPEDGNSIRGMKYNDLNGNGQKDPGEPGLAGWTIFLDSNDNSSFDEGEPQTTTDANGNYAFTNLEAGVYRIHEVNQPGWRQTDPAVDGVPGYWLIDLEEGQDVTEIDFGNYQQGTSPQVDVFDLCLNVEIDIPGIGLVRTSLTGPVTIQTQVGPNGEASDQGGNGLDEVVTELTDMNLTGVDPTVGQLRMRLNSNMVSTGQIEERANNNPGVLDIPPFTPTGNADSFFDVFFQVELPDLGVVLLTNQPIRLTAVITHLPPVEDYSDISQATVELWDQNVQPTGIHLGPITSCQQAPPTGEYDFGDAPQNGITYFYPTTLAQNGARHRIDSDVFLGLGVESDPDGQPGPLANGDNDDGVTFTSPLIPGTVASVTITASVPGLLYGWIDFQQDGRFDVATDHVFTGQVLSAGPNVLGMAIPSNAVAGTTYARFRFSRDSILGPEGEAPNGEVEDYLVEIEAGDIKGSVKIIKEAMPADDTPFLFCANFSPGSFFDTLCIYLKDPSNNTWTFNNPNSLQQINETVPAGWTLTDIAITGDTDNGSTIDLINATVDLDYDEGENIVITFKNEKTGETQYDFGDAPDSYKTLHNSGGPYHDIGQVMIGNSVDAEQDGQPGPFANADNDDGVSLPLGLEVNQFATVVVNINSPLGVPAAITGWIDFDQNGTFEDPTERIAGGIYTGAGVPVSWTETFLVPSTALSGSTYARFRIYRTEPGVDVFPSPTSYGGEGEVEDYLVEIKPAGDQPPSGNLITGIKFNDLDGDGLWEPGDGESGLPNWTIWLDTNNDGIPDQTTKTNSQGGFEFPGVSAGTYTVGEQQQTGWIQTSPPAPGTFTFTIPAGTFPTVHFMMFGNKQSDLPTGQVDFGDAPVSYGNAWHTLNDNLTLGSMIDAESMPYYSSDATGDDIHQTDDEDGILFSSSLAWGKTVEVCAEVHNNDSTSKEVIIAGWIDFDGNNQWDLIGDDIGTRNVYLPANSIVTDCWTFTVPQDANPGVTFARFRLYKSDPNPMATPIAILPIGDGGEGEVEDYQVYILSDAPGPDEGLDYGDAPLSYGSASHDVGRLRIGDLIDGEINSQYSISANGDDLYNINDEDGVSLLSDLVPGQNASYQIKLTTVPGSPDYNSPAWVAAWIDFNQDGQFQDVSEAITPFSYVWIQASQYELRLYNFQVPTTAKIGNTFMRVRATPHPGPQNLQWSPTGYGGEGEVEDYQVEIKLDGNPVPPGEIIGGIKFNDINGNGQQDAGESGLANWTIWIDLNGNGVKDAGEDTLTNPDGSFYLAGLTDGTYTVYEEMQSGWIQTYPSGAGTHTITVQAGQNTPSIIFGNRQSGLDYGDAPLPYPEASHQLGGPYLGPFGNLPDPEQGMQRNPQAEGDDNDADGDDENGLLSIDLVKTPGAWSLWDIKGCFNSSSDAKIGFWIDLNGDGDWDDPNELRAEFGWCSFTSGPQDWFRITGAFKLPADAKVGTTYARLRVYNDCSTTISPSGAGGPGEVEDYAIEIKADGPGVPPGGIVHGYKWNDINGNGIWNTLNPIEPALSGWTFWLDINNNGQQDAGDMYEQTDAAGHFQFMGVPAGTYTLGEQLQSGWTQTIPTGAGTYTVTVQPGQGTFPMMFGNQQSDGPTFYGRICGSKWNDLNGDGIPNSNEPYMAGWTIYLDMNQNNQWDPGEPSQLTDASGSFEFTGLAVGSYTVAEEMQPGWKQTWPGGTGTHIISVQFGPIQPACVMFGNQQAQAGPSIDWGDAPDPSYPTLLSNNGAHHTIVPGLFLGDGVDPDADGQPALDARGDDYDGSDDEDGVTFITPIMPGQQAEVEVIASSTGYLDAWIDFDADENWSQASDQIFTSESTLAGSNILSFHVPASIAIDIDTYARFRFSSAGGLAPDGSAQDGEVEDYHILLGENGPGVPGEEDLPHVKWSQPPIEIDSNIDTPPVFCGWDEPARSTEQSGQIRQWRMDADDFRCLGSIPVTRIRWWGGYKSWSQPEPPESQPEAWHIGIWANQVEGINQDESFLERLVWSVEVPNERVHSAPTGLTEFPQQLGETCFVYEVQLEPEEWFHQREFESNDNIFWISITAIYPADAQQVNQWGWTTRPHIWGHGAVMPAIMGDWPTFDERLFPGRIYPIENSLLCGQNQAYDLCFELLTEQPWVKWDQPFTGIREWQDYSDNKSVAFEQDGGELLMSRQVADDWFCERQDPVTAIVWNGSYIGYGYEACKCDDIPEPRKPDYFLLSIWDNTIGDDPELNNYPGEKIWEFRAENYDEVLVGYDRNPDGESNEPVFRYSVKLPEDAWFRQDTPENIFWFDVVAVFRESAGEIPYDWGWTNHSHTFGSPALSIDSGMETTSQWQQQLDSTGRPVDMSFTLLTTLEQQSPTGQVYYSKSADNGATFEPGTIIGDTSVEPAPRINPAIAVDDQGIVHVVWEDYGTNPALANIMYTKSKDGGINFDESIMVDDAITVSTHQAKPQIAVDNDGIIHVVWEDYRRDSRLGDIYYAKSTDSGMTFGDDVCVDDLITITSRQINPVIAVDSRRIIHVAWEDYRDNAELGNIYYAKSTDGGQTFGTDIRIDDTFTDTTHQCNPSIATESLGTVFIAWEDYRNAPYLGDIYCARSIDGGETFQENLMVDDPITITHRQIRPAIAVDVQGIVYVVWEDYRDNTELGNIYCARSIDGGKTFEDDVMVDAIYTHTTHQANPAIATAGQGLVHIVWEDYRNRPEQANIYYSMSVDEGKTFGEDLIVNEPGPVTSSRHNPVIAVDNLGVVYLLWQQ